MTCSQGDWANLFGNDTSLAYLWKGKEDWSEIREHCIVLIVNTKQQLKQSLKHDTEARKNTMSISSKRVQAKCVVTCYFRTSCHYRWKGGLIYFWLTRASPSRSERTRSELNGSWLVGSPYDIIRVRPERDEVMSPSYMSRDWSAHYAGFILGIGRIRWLVAIVNTALILALTYPKAAVRTLSAMIFFLMFFSGDGHYLHENHNMQFSRPFFELSRTFGKIQGLSRPWKLIFKFKDFSRIPGPLRTLNLKKEVSVIRNTL